MKKMSRINVLHSKVLDIYSCAVYIFSRTTKTIEAKCFFNLKIKSGLFKSVCVVDIIMKQSGRNWI